MDYDAIKKKLGEIKGKNRKTNYNPQIKKSLKEDYSGKETKESYEAYLNKRLIDIESSSNLFSKRNFSLDRLDDYYGAFNSLSERGEKKGVNINKYLEALKKREERAININLKKLEKNYSSEKEETFRKLIDYIEKKSPTNELGKQSGLEKSLVVISIGSLLASLFFVSNNLTGNAILSSEPKTSMFLGAGLFVLGLVSFIFAKKKF